LGDVFESVPAANYPHVAVVGLGVGSVAAYRRGSQTFTFFEIDPAVERLARQRSDFSYLADCGNSCRVVIGDARQSMTADRQEYGVIVLDAFSSDAIPIHLLTREAVAVYLRRLAVGGVLAFHISNRHLDLEPVLARVADDAGLVSMIRRNRVDSGDDPSGRSSSDWLLMARSPEHLGTLGKDWSRAHPRENVKMWTDDFSNILTLLLRR